MSDAPDVLELPAVLDLAFAPALRDLLLRALGDSGDVGVNAAAVTHADTSCLQLLCAATMALAGRGRSLKLIEPSPALIRVAERLGVAKTLGTPGPSQTPHADSAR